MWLLLSQSVEFDDFGWGRDAVRMDFDATAVEPMAIAVHLDGRL
jgi:hypothetical protein